MILKMYIYKYIHSLVNVTVGVFLSGTQFFPDPVPDVKITLKDYVLHKRER